MYNPKGCAHPVGSPGSGIHSPMQSVLILNTALSRAAALALAGDRVIACRARDSHQSAQTILQLARQALDEAGLRRTDAVAVVAGPGSFTGTRIGVAAAQGLCAAWEAPALPLSTLALVATAAMRLRPADTCLAAIRSRVDEMYFGCYRRTAAGLVLHGKEQAGALPQLVVEAPEPNGALDPDRDAPRSGASGASRKQVPGFGEVVTGGDCWPETAVVETHFGLRLRGEVSGAAVEDADLVRVCEVARERGAFVAADLLRPNYVTAAPRYREHSASG